MDEKKLQIYQVGIKGVIVNPKNKALVMLKTVNGKTFWDVPGGRMEKGETIKQTMDRELREEIPNIKEFRVKNILNVDAVHRLDTVEDIDLLLVFYKVESNLEKIELSKEHQLYRWVSLEEIKLLEKDAPIRDGIKEALMSSLKRNT
ncbi:MAG TPA: NUDIX domain-containing protein [Candidatus Pacearchaeota archaeon]|nr:NUDIX domain-containing protein [Candidatus Pacearchaeota archaeon]HPR79658.1 NUDIX domain-containing protein [Candidatus Pacearchaeota archaeon]